MKNEPKSPDPILTWKYAKVSYGVWEYHRKEQIMEEIGSKLSFIS
jgi:hypothetical protein